MLRLYKEVVVHPHIPLEGIIGEKNIRIVHSAGDDVGAGSCCNCSFPPFAPKGAAGDHFIVPRTPFRMARNAILIRPSSKVGFCLIYSGLRFIGRIVPSKYNQGDPGGVLHAAL